MKIHQCLLAVALTIFLPIQICSAEEVKKDTADSLTDELLVAFKKLPVVIGKVTDKASAEIAAKEIEKISVEVDKIVKRLEPLPEPSDEVKLAIDKKMDKSTDALGQQLGESFKKISEIPEALEIITAAMQKFGTEMEKHDKTFKKFGKNTDEEEEAAPDPEEEE